MSFSQILIESIGWLGSVLVLVAYFLNILGKMPAETLSYKLLNIFGSICLVVITAYKETWQSMAVNIIWAGIAIVLLVKNWNQNK